MLNLKNQSRRRGGFTLIEVLIVVVILGILAATVLPQFTSSTANAKESALRGDLSTLRSQINLFKFQHDGVYPSGAADNVVKQLTLASDLVGGTAAAGTAGYPYGPYFIGQLPMNPYSGGNGVLCKTGTLGAADVDPTAMQGGVKVGWVYSTTTGQIIANSPGAAADGVTLLSAL